MIRQNISLKIKQELALRPKMLQSLKLLTLPILELENYIKQELESNPVLEIREEKDSDESLDRSSVDDFAESNIPIDSDEEFEDTIDAFSEAKKLTEILDNWNEYHEAQDAAYERHYAPENSEMAVRYEKNEKEAFLEQIYIYDLNDDEVAFMTELVDSCDVYGFLPKGFSIQRAANRYGLSYSRGKELHQLVMSLSPRGITAQSVSECLLAQLDDNQKENPILSGMVTEHFEDLIHRRYQKIASFYNVSVDTILNYKELISKLDPKPGLRILSSNASYIYPDVTLKLIDGEYEVIINDSITPNIVISSRYRKMLSSGASDKETTSFVREKINNAKFLIKSIHMRMRTLEQVSRSIIKHQKDFFYNGSGIIHSLTYSTIANDINKNESTISRVVKDKYIETPYGMFAFKDFFTSTAGRDDNYESISRNKVKNYIIRLIDSEDKEKPYSDQNLVELLKEEGLNVSRRIIAKYRDELGILNSRLRKK